MDSICMKHSETYTTLILTLSANILMHEVCKFYLVFFFTGHLHLNNIQLCTP